MTEQQYSTGVLPWSSGHRMVTGRAAPPLKLPRSSMYYPATLPLNESLLVDAPAAEAAAIIRIRRRRFQCRVAAALRLPRRTRQQSIDEKELAPEFLRSADARKTSGRFAYYRHVLPDNPVCANSLVCQNRTFARWHALSLEAETPR